MTMQQQMGEILLCLMYIDDYGGRSYEKSNKPRINSGSIIFLFSTINGS